MDPFWTLDTIELKMKDGKMRAESTGDRDYGRNTANEALVLLTRLLSERLPDEAERAHVEGIIGIWESF